MTSSRRSATSLAAALIYLAGLVGGALHHHAHGTVHVSDGVSSLLARSADSDCCGENGQTCTLCAAIYQAKTAPPAPVVVTSHTVVDQVVIDATCQSPVLLGAPNRARAPPVL
jgi:hypothetical protein